MMFFAYYERACIAQLIMRMSIDAETEEKLKSESEVKEITTLIGHHYKKDRLDSHNAQLVLEADGLAKIDWEHIPPNFDKENSLKYLEYFKGRNLPKFKTETGKRFLKDLLAKSESYCG